MARKPEKVSGMAEAITQRRAELGMDVAALVEASGVTRQGLAPLLRGERKAYQDRLMLGVCQALKWTPDSITRLLRGELAQPVSLPSDARTAEPELAARVAQLEGAYSAPSMGQQFVPTK